MTREPRLIALQTAGERFDPGLIDVSRQRKRQQIAARRSPFGRKVGDVHAQRFLRHRVGLPLPSLVPNPLHDRLFPRQRQFVGRRRFVVVGGRGLVRRGRRLGQLVT